MKPVGVFYATRAGHTERVADEVVAGLRTRGLGVVCANVADAQAPFELAACSAAVLASSVHMGRHEREMIDFATRHRDALRAMPNAFLSVTLSEAGAQRKDATPEQHASFVADVRAMTDRFVADTGWQPEHVVPVAGALRYTQYNFVVRMLMKHIAAKAGGSTDTLRDHDYTDWAALDAFVGRFAEEVVARASADDAAT